ncbi:MAG TPA: hypothetical protein PKD15_04130 [Candidatus Saccharibacteria bacterium]|nr:hypothetical protein [Candidatus Saccharibacteria bacterium]
MAPYLFAHGGEIHSSAIESSAHALSWYIQLPLFCLIMIGIYSLLQLLIKQRSTLFLILASILLITGFATYSVAPVISVTSITVGMASTLVITLIGLGETDGKKKDKETK